MSYLRLMCPGPEACDAGLLTKEAHSEHAGRVTHSLRICRRLCSIICEMDTMFTCTNRLGVVYYIHETPTKAGSRRYTMNRVADGALAELPAGCERYLPLLGTDKLFEEF